MSGNNDDWFYLFVVSSALVMFFTFIMLGVLSIVGITQGG